MLNVVSAIIVIVLGFIFEMAYHDGNILFTGIICSLILTSNYLLSYYSPLYRRNFSNITFVSVFILHFWAVYVSSCRNFEIDTLIPLSISIFSFSLIFNRFFKSLVFIFSITSTLLLLMYIKGDWQQHFTITLVALYAGAFLSLSILKRRAEFYSEIQNQEKRYFTLVENMNDGLIYLGDKHEILIVNDKFCNITGFSREEVVGKTFSFLSNLLKDTNTKTLTERLDKQELFRSETQMRKKSGSSIWVQITSAPHFEDGKFIGSIIVYTDITPLKHAQESLKKREEGYRTFIDQSAVGIWRAEYVKPISTLLSVEEQIHLLLDTGIITECNDFMAKMYGYNSSSELIGRRIRDFYHIENNFDDEKTKQLMHSFIANNYRITNAESKELDRQGVVRIMLNNNIGIVENGFLIRTWGVQTDITDRKKTEKELMETNQELDTFFYKASHDLKGPLASVMGIVNLARLENKDSIIEKYFEMIEKSINRLDRTLMDLIELAQTRRGTSKLTEVRLKPFVIDILNSLKHLQNFEKINFELNIDEDAEIVADKVLLLSVFQNLVHNAINYCNKDKPKIRIQVVSSGNGMELTISDNGKGIPEKIKNRVFEMFYRGHPDSSGSGLGLFIVKNALEKMHGKISFESKEGMGTSFIVYIPNTSILV